MKSDQIPQDPRLLGQRHAQIVQDDPAQNLDLQQQLILEQYSIWKKNTPHLYDILQQQGIDWPSLTVEWLPTHDIPQTSQFSVQKLLVGTHTTGSDQNYIKVLRVRMPLPQAKLQDVQAKLDEDLKYDDKLGRQNSSRNAIITQTIIAHQGDIHKARVMPSKSNIFATMSETGSVYIWDYSKHPSKPKIGEQRHHQLHLIGHQREGYGLDWNSKIEGKLISGAFDWKIILWDIASASKLNTQLAPIRQIDTKLNQVNDVKWHRFDPQLFGSIHDEGIVAMWDARDSKEIVNKFRAHAADGITLDFNHQNAYLMATGGDDNAVKVWDLRKPKIALMSLEGHQNGVQTVAFSPFHQMILASGSKDRRVNWWNLYDIVKDRDEKSRTPPIVSKLRFDKKDDYEYKTPKGLIFIHAGHTGEVSDISWNKNEKMVMASVAEDNSVEVYSWRSEKYSFPGCNEN